MRYILTNHYLAGLFVIIFQAEFNCLAKFIEIIYDKIYMIKGPSRITVISCCSSSKNCLSVNYSINAIAKKDIIFFK